MFVTFYGIIFTTANILNNQTNPHRHIYGAQTHVYKLTFAMASNLSAMVGLQVTVTIDIPPKGIIPSDGTIVTIDEALLLQTCK